MITLTKIILDDDCFSIPTDGQSLGFKVYELRFTL